MGKWTGLQRYMEKSSRVVKEELLGRSGAKYLPWPPCSPPAPRAPGHLHLPHTSEEEEAQEGLGHQPQPCTPFSALWLQDWSGLGGKGWLLCAGKWMDGATPPSSLAKTGVSHSPLWCGLHFTLHRNVAADRPKEQWALEVRARKHHWVLLIYNNVAPSLVLSWET